MDLLSINNKYNIFKKGTINKCIYKKGEGGDKYSEKNYHIIYEKYFINYKYKNIKFLEIGILEGYSLAVHSDYFPNAELYGYDIDIEPYNKNLEYLKSIGCFTNNNVKDIKKINSIKKVDLKIRFDIILDDGDHNPCAQVKTFENYYPYLNDNGIYIIEDVTDFRIKCLKIYLDYLGIDFKYEIYNGIIGSVIIKKQNINFNKKEEAYDKMNGLSILKPHSDWWAKQYKIN